MGDAAERLARELVAGLALVSLSADGSAVLLAIETQGADGNTVRTDTYVLGVTTAESLADAIRRVAGGVGR